jgi:hypothetical protein
MTNAVSTPSTTKLAQYLITTSLILWGFAVLIMGMETMHLRPDEFLTIGNMRYSFYESMLRLATRNNQAHLWWITMWVWQRLAGVSEFALRYHSILLSMLTLAVVYRIGRDWFGESRYGWFAIIMLSVNSYFFIYSLEARMYALAMLTTVLSMRMFYGWLTKRTWQSAAIMYGLSAAAMLYTHYYMAFVILAQIVYFAIFHLFNLKLIRQALIAGLIALCAWLPGILIISNQLEFIRFATEGGLNIPTEPTTVVAIYALAQVSSSGLLWLYVAIIAIGTGLLWRKIGYRLVLVWMLAAPGLVLLVNLRLPVFTERYTSFTAPSIGILVGATIAVIPAVWLSKHKSDERHANLVSWIVVLIIAGISLYNLPTQIPERAPRRHIYREISAVSPENAVLYITHIDPNGNETELMRRYLAADIFDNRVESIDEAAENRYVWFVTNDWFDDSVRQQFAMLVQSHRVEQVIGDCKPEWCYLAQLMIAPPQIEPIVFGDSLGFHGADVEITTSTIEALLWWSVDEQPTQDYSISLQLLDSSGTLVTQVDRQIKPPDFDEIPTSQMQPDNSYLDLRELQLPVNLASGEYLLQLAVYQWQDNTRLTLPDGRDTLLIQNMSIE